MSFKQNLQREIPLWVKEGLISPETAETLIKRYPVAKRSMTQTLALLGVILLGIGVILFFAANWQLMPRILKIAVVVFSFTFSYASGYYLRYHKGTYPKVGYALLCLGSLLYGASIWLIAQIFHLQAEESLGFLLWYLGVMPVAFLFRSSFNLFLALLNLIAWFIAGNYPLGWAHLVFPLFLACCLLLAAAKKDLFNFALSTVAAYIWFAHLSIRLAADSSVPVMIFLSLLLLSLIIYTLVRQFKDKPFFAAHFLQLLSLLGIFAGFAPFTFHDFMKVFADKVAFEGYPYLLAGSLLLVLCFKLKERNLGFDDLPLVMLLPCLLPFFPSLGLNSLLLVVLNLLLFLFTLYVMFSGYRSKKPHVFNLSLILFALAVVLKYFDFFFALLPRSIFFMSGGALLLLGSILLEYKRRSLLITMERGE